MKDWKRSPEPESMMGHKRLRSSSPPPLEPAYQDNSAIAGPGPRSEARAAAAKAAEDRQKANMPRRMKLMSLADMCFKTVMTHLNSADEETLEEVSQYAPTLNPRFSDPLIQACSAKSDQLKRLERAKKAALKAREVERSKRPTSVAIQVDSVRKDGRPIKKVPKTAGGRKIWAKAAAAAGRRN